MNHISNQCNLMTTEMNKEDTSYYYGTLYGCRRKK